MSLRRLLVRAVAGLSLAAFLVPSLAAAAAFAPLPPLTATCLGAGQSHAAVVVQHSNGAVVTRCVTFSGPSISGEALLKASGIDYRVQSYGGFGDAICQVDVEPAAYSDCLGKTYYWALFVAAPGGTWQFATTGISNATIRDGGAEGFRYEPQSGSAAAPPSPAGVCAATQPTPRPSRIPTPVPTRPPTPAPTPTRSATPSAATASHATTPSATATSTEATATPTPSPTASATPAASDPPLPSATPAAVATTTGTGGGSSGLPLGTVAAAAGATALAGLFVLRGLRGRGAAR